MGAGWLDTAACFESAFGKLGAYLASSDGSYAIPDARSVHATHAHERAFAAVSTAV